MMVLSIFCYVLPALFFGFVTLRSYYLTRDFPPEAVGAIDLLRNELPLLFMLAVGVRDWRAAGLFTSRGRTQDGLCWFAYVPVTLVIFAALTLLMLVPLPG